MFRRSFILFSSLIVILLCSYHQVNAQSYLPFPESGAAWKWEYGESDISCDFGFAVVDSILGDTVISGKKYLALYTIKTKLCDSDPPGCGGVLEGLGYKGGIRTDTLSGETYFVSKGSTSEGLLYDYSLEVGDTLHSFLNPTPTSPWIVSRVDTIVLGSKSRRRLQFPGFMADVIEGVGGIFGLLNSLDIFLGLGTILHCYSENGNPIYHLPGSCTQTDDCNQVVSNEIEFITRDQFTLFPNPGTNKIQLKGDFNFPLQVQMYDLNGQVLLTSEMKNVNESIDTSQLPRGMYFIKIEDREVKVGFGKWIKE